MLKILWGRRYSQGSGPVRSSINVLFLQFPLGHNRWFKSKPHLGVEKVQELPASMFILSMGFLNSWINTMSWEPRFSSLALEPPLTRQCTQIDQQKVGQTWIRGFFGENNRKKIKLGQPPRSFLWQKAGCPKKNKKGGNRRKKRIDEAMWSGY